MMRLVFAAVSIAVATAHMHVPVPQAMATLNVNGAMGYVKVGAGKLSVMLDLTNFTYPGSSTPAICRSGITYHLHETPASNVTGGSGNTECASTGGHYDPWNACGGATGSLNCVSTGGCIPAGQVGTYTCTSATYAANPLTACEVGDWSGKYGALTPLVVNGSTYGFNSTASRWEISSPELYSSTTPRSVTFHCGATRILCANFVPNVMVNESAAMEGPGVQAVTTGSAATNGRLVADFGAVGGPLIQMGGGSIFVSGLSVQRIVSGTLGPSGCGVGGLPVMTIGPLPWPSNWTMNYAQNASCDAVQGVYDPTVSCVPGSQFTNTYCLVNPLTMNSTICNGSTNQRVFNYATALMTSVYVEAQGSVIIPPSALMDPMVLLNGTLIPARLKDQRNATLVGKSVTISCLNKPARKWCAKIVDAPSAYVANTPPPTLAPSSAPTPATTAGSNATTSTQTSSTQTSSAPRHGHSSIFGIALVVCLAGFQNLVLA